MSQEESGPPRMNVLDTIGAAINRTVWMFNPFNAGYWLRMGFIVFMGFLMSGGCGGSFPPYLNALGMPGAPGPSSSNPYVPSSPDQGLQYLAENIWLIATLIVVTLIPIAIVSTIFIWIGCRGHMMLIRAVATNKPDIRESWTATKELGSSLFKFRVSYLVVLLLVFTPAILMSTVFIIEVIQTELAPRFSYIFGMLAVAGFTIVGTLFMTIVDASLKCFVTPIMYHKDIACMDAWRIFLGLAKKNVLPIAGFFLIRIGCYMVFGVLNSIAMMFTCCLSMLPIVNQVILAPLFVFDRAYSIYALESLGPEWQIIERPDLDNLPEPEPPKYQSPPME